MTLAIVIPAFKGRFFRGALRSLAAQTDQDFAVYVGDDHSPEDLRSICAEFRQRLRIVYHRFESNLGGASLANHWNRCVALSSERWIWLFSDDDLADPQSVEAFRSTIASGEQGFDLYRFPVGIVDKDDNVVFALTRHGEVQSSLDFAIRRLRSAQMSFAVDKIFSRRAFEREGGFVDFPCAWCSDDASWIAFGRETGSRQIPRGGVYWRWSDVNLSSTSAPNQREKTLAAILFLEWLNADMERAPVTEAERMIVKANYQGWFYHQLFTLSPRLSVDEILGYSARLARACGSSRLRALFRFVRSRLRILLARSGSIRQGL